MSSEKILYFIRTYSELEDYERLTNLIMDLDDSSVKSYSHFDELIHTLDIQDHAVGIMCLLLKKLAIPTIDFDRIFVQIAEFISDCKESYIKRVPNLFANLCHTLTNKLIEQKTYLKGLDPLMKAIVKLQTSQTQLTSIHTDLCKLALLSKCVKPALTILDIDITDIHKENDTYDVQDYLLYFYYGGIIYCTVNNFERACFFFQSALTPPGSAVSQIMIESYKKYTLVSLLAYRKLQPLSKQITSVVNRTMMKGYCNPYTQLASAFESNSFEEVNRLLDKYKNLFIEDVNYGLVKQVLSTMIKSTISKLTKTFVTLSISDVASKVRLSPEETQLILLQMIEDGEMFATISQQNGMVTFTDNPERYNSVQMYQQIENELIKCIRLNQKLKKLEEDIMFDSKFVAKSMMVLPD